MKYFFDTEFIEDGKTIDLISIAIVCEDGREYYAVNKDCNFSKTSNWVLENVLLPMGLDRKGLKAVNPSDPSCSPLCKQALLDSRSKKQIAHEIIEFVYEKDYSPEPMLTPEFWAYYADYDWVVFCQLFGTMMDLPSGFPMFCFDIKQEHCRLGSPPLPRQKGKEHNALEDARWVKEAYEILSKMN